MGATASVRSRRSGDARRTSGRCHRIQAASRRRVSEPAAWSSVRPRSPMAGGAALPAASKDRPRRRVAGADRRFLRVIPLACVATAFCPLQCTAFLLAMHRYPGDPGPHETSWLPVQTCVEICVQTSVEACVEACVVTGVEI